MSEGEKPEGMGSQPGPGKEHFEKFKIGSTEEDMEKFRGPEWRSEVPDIRMQLKEDDSVRRVEYEQSQERYRAGYALTEALRTSENPRAIRLAAMEYMKSYEDIRYSTQSFRSPYDLGRVIQEIQDRASVLSISTKDLMDKEQGWGIVTELDKDNLTGEVNVAGFALGERVKKIKRKKGKYEEEMEIKVPYIGTDAERAAASQALREAHAEIVVGGVLHSAYVFHEKNSENIKGLSEVYLHDLLTGEALETFFNLPRLWEEGTLKTEGGKEIKSRGEMVHLAMRMWEVIGLSEKRDELNFYRGRPGWQALFPGSTVDRPSEAEKKWVGKVNRWEGKGKFRENEEVVKKEVDEEKRGVKGVSLTEFGNVLAHPAKDVEEIRERIRRFLGGGKDAPPILRSIVEWAEEKAFRFNRPWGMMDNRGWEIYEPEKGKYELEMTMGPGVTSDYLKVTDPTLYRWKNKQGLKRRDAGPIYTRARYKKFMVPFLEVLTYEVEIKGKTEKEKRTLQELIWGYEDETYITDEGEKKYFDLGEIKWKREFGRYPESDFFLKGFFVAREKDGIYDLTRKADWTAKELYDMINHDWWEQYMKRIEVAFPSAVVERGVLKGKTEEEMEERVVAFWEGIIRGTWDGVRSSKIYRSLREEGYKVTIPGTNILVDRKITDEIQKVVKDVMGIELDTKVLPLEKTQTREPFWEKDIKDYQYPYPNYIEIE